MNRTLEKTRKQIVKKKGPLGTVHEGSRDSRRLRKALARDGRLGKLAANRKKQEQPLGTCLPSPATVALTVATVVAVITAPFTARTAAVAAVVTVISSLSTVAAIADSPVDRTSFFQDSIRETGIEAFDEEQFLAAIKSFVHQHDEEMDDLKQARRPGRPASMREDTLKVKIAALEKEFQNGFMVPDLTSKDNVSALEKWDGTWLHLNSLNWVRITNAGALRPAAFPPNKD